MITMRCTAYTQANSARCVALDQMATEHSIQICASPQPAVRSITNLRASVSVCVCGLFEMKHSISQTPPVHRPMNNGSWASRHHCRHTTPRQHRSTLPIVNHTCNVMTEAFTHCKRSWAHKSTSRSTAHHLCRKQLRAQRPKHKAHAIATTKDRACDLFDVSHIEIAHESRAFPLTGTKNLCQRCSTLQKVLPTHKAPVLQTMENPQCRIHEHVPFSANACHRHLRLVPVCKKRNRKI